ncbi:MAG: hypothetical protein GY920_00220 [Aliivibrio sp.]|nr:hypothetical protein [Aliivibrio sp.]MCP4321054.1 hypothetical protein [Alteromonadales bacterium]
MKLLTEEMVQDALKKLGFSKEQISEQDGDFTQLVLDHYGARVDDHWADQNLYVYEESTRDGYSVWICTHNPNSINIAEDVYYSEHNTYIVSEVQDAIRNGLSIYCDDEATINDAIEDMCQTVYDDVRADVEMEFHDKGYVWPTKIPALLKEVRDILTADTVVQNPETIKRIDVALEQLNNKNDN